MFGRSFIGQNTFVAMTSSSSFAMDRSARPVISSLTPSEYMSAVSKKLIPLSSANLKKGWAAVSSSTQARHWGLP